MVHYSGGAGSEVSSKLRDESGLVVEPALDVQALRETGYKRVGTVDVKSYRVRPLNTQQLSNDGRRAMVDTYLVNVRLCARHVVDHGLDYVGNLRQHINLLDQALVVIRRADVHMENRIDLALCTNSWRRPLEDQLGGCIVTGIRIVRSPGVCRTGDHLAFQQVLSGILCFGGDGRKLAAEDERADIDGHKAGARALLAIVVYRSEFHLDRRHAAVCFTLEVRKVPAGGNEVRAHTLNSMHEHARALGIESLTFEGDSALGGGARPEAVDDVALGVSEVCAEVGEPALGALADLEPGHASGARDLDVKFEVVAKVGVDGVCLRLVTVGVTLVRDRELVRLAGALVKPGRRGHEVGDVHRLPEPLACVGVVYLGGDLDRRVPYADAKASARRNVDAKACALTRQRNG